MRARFVAMLVVGHVAVITLAPNHFIFSVDAIQPTKESSRAIGIKLNLVIIDSKARK